MIYFDNAATTYPKPPSVIKAMNDALISCGNPGRGGHMLGRNAEKIMYDCRVEAAELFGIDDETKIVFTNNATHALNLAIKSVLHDGGHAVAGGYEHNSVIRPLEKMENVEYDVAYSELFNEDDAFEKIASKIRKDTKCVVLNHVSNVFGNELPIHRIDDLCYEKGIDLILDVSQSAGCEKIDVSDFKAVRFMCMPGHKGLYGPSGTGILVCCKEEKLYSIIEGGTGSLSSDFNQPGFLPDIFESGTQNFVGIAGLLEGIRFVRGREMEISAHKKYLIERLYDRLADEKRLKVFFSGRQKSLISISADKKNDDIFEYLCGENICVRNGLHCAPVAHKSGHTEDYGTIRISFSVFNTEAEVDHLAKILKKYIKSL